MITRLLLVVVVLTLAPMQAWAECAWVLWSNYGTEDVDVPITAPSVVSGKVSEWQPLEAFATTKACETALSNAQRRESNMKVERNKSKPKGTLWNVFTFRCLPDTIDPRGPKGSGR
jgi:hypothetical protein